MLKRNEDNKILLENIGDFNKMHVVINNERFFNVRIKNDIFFAIYL